ncbi:acyltransferase family protein [Spongisporangium articulatum]|uniref:Acyltransferase family protein n=1 Tax=Spongisporangium articulatum TaxID=3362603 RepID=A0ABW8ANE3_9ACTN
MAVEKRDAGVDLARVVGLTAMVAGHVWTEGQPYRLTYTWHMPLFFLLAGWFWRPGRSLSREWVNRLRTLLVPYVAWLVLVAAFFFAYEAPNILYWSKEIVVGGAVARPFSAFWFITALAAVCLLRRGLEVAGLGLPAVTALAAAGWLLSYPFGDRLHDVPESLGTVAYTLVFVVAGEWLRRFTDRLERRLALTAALVLVASGLALAATGVVEPMNLKQGELGTPVAGYLVAVAVSWGLLVLCTALGRVSAEPVRRAVTELAVVALPLVLLHASVILVMGTQRWSTFVVALVVPWAVGLVLVRSPLAPLLVGTAPAAPERPADRRVAVTRE